MMSVQNGVSSLQSVANTSLTFSTPVNTVTAEYVNHGMEQLPVCPYGTADSRDRSSSLSESPQILSLHSNGGSTGEQSSNVSGFNTSVYMLPESSSIHQQGTTLYHQSCSFPFYGEELVL
jgi:hypothetical protein